MANDSHHFRTAEELERKVIAARETSTWPRRPLPAALRSEDAPPVRSSVARPTRTAETTHVAIVPAEKRSAIPSFVVQPRYWVREDVVESAIPKYPEPLAAALQIGHRPSIQRVLCLWAAGYHLNHGREQEGDKLLLTANRFDLDRSVDRAFSEPDPHSRAIALERDFRSTSKTWRPSASNWASLRTSPATLLAASARSGSLAGVISADATDERTLIASAVPTVAVGHKFPLILSVLKCS